MADRDVFVVGGANSAGQAALHLAEYARRVTIVVRADSLGAGMSHYLVQQIEAVPNIEVRLKTEVVGGDGEERLERLLLRERGGAVEEVDAHSLFLKIGARPNTDWLPQEVLRDERGFIRTGVELADGPEWPLERMPFALETGMPGVFAVGDVREGSMNRVAAAVGRGVDRGAAGPRSVCDRARRGHLAGHRGPRRPFGAGPRIGSRRPRSVLRTRGVAGSNPPVSVVATTVRIAANRRLSDLPVRAVRAAAQPLSHGSLSATLDPGAGTQVGGFGPA